MSRAGGMAARSRSKLRPVIASEAQQPPAPAAAGRQRGLWLLWGRWHRAKGGGLSALASWRKQLRGALGGALDVSAGAVEEQGALSVSNDKDHPYRDEPPALWDLLGSGGDGGGHLLAWAGPSAVGAGLAQEVCATLLDVQSQQPLISSQILGLLIAAHAADVGDGAGTIQSKASPFVSAIKEALALCPGLSHAALEPALGRCFLHQAPAMWGTAVDRLLALASQLQQRLAAPTAAALLRVLASAADTAQRAAPTSISAANVDTALVSLLLWLRGQFLRGGAAMQASIVLSLLDVVDSITATQPFSAPAAAVLLAIGSLRGDATQAAAHQGTTTRRLRRGLQALSGHAPAAWRPLFVSCALAAPDPHFSPAGPSNLPRTLVALRGLLGIQHEQQQQRREEEGELEQPAKQPRTRASSAPQSIAAARGLDPVEVLPVDAMVSIFRFLGYRRVAKTAAVSNAWADLLRSPIIDDALWRPLFHQQLAGPWRRAHARRHRLFERAAAPLLSTASASGAQHGQGAERYPPLPLPVPICTTAYAAAAASSLSRGSSGACQQCGGRLSLDDRTQERAAISTPHGPRRARPSACLLAPSAERRTWRDLLKARLAAESEQMAALEEACQLRGRRATLARLAEAYYRRVCPVMGCNKVIDRATAPAHERHHRTKARGKAMAGKAAGDAGAERKR